jgi:uncharacterized membrane protein YhiD involved in acid resistance
MTALFALRFVAATIICDRRCVTMSLNEFALRLAVALILGSIVRLARVEVVADVTVKGRADARLEKIVTRLGVEPGVTAISWKIVPTDEDEQAMIPEA